ncbi:MAG: DUF2892 domain-containing protein [Gammaproteobacteria bacterium]|nr:DUF2892 domain-containing protein [Gammaproteobacteria bacterium]
MKINESRDDRIVRVVLGIVLIGLGGIGFLSIFGIIAIATGVIGYCPIYNAMGKSTCSNQS